MPRPEGAKILWTRIECEADPELYEWVSAWREDHRGVPAKQMMTAAIELFMRLPDPIKAILLVCKRDDPAYEQIVQAVSTAVVSVDAPWHSMTCEALVKLRGYLEEALYGDADMVKAEDLKATLDESAAAREASGSERKLRPGNDL